MNNLLARLCLAGALLVLAAPPPLAADPLPPAPAYWQWAATPPMGWNSYDAFGSSVTEDEVMANADYMKQHLRAHGWKYVVVDYRWYDPNAAKYGTNGVKGAPLTMDNFGRLLPSPNRFPSAADGKGFKGLSNKIHALGLKFGIHVMRGIPRQAVDANAPIEGSAFHAADAANLKSACGWCADMWGVNGNSAAGQSYYDALFRLYASWGVDYVKVDDLSQPYHTDEIEAIRKAIDKCGRSIVFSTSPGETSLTQAAHISTQANSWRASSDFWDNWGALHHAFDLAAKWQGVSGPGHWPDMDMIPFGRIGIRSVGPDRQSKFTADEQRTLMTLWCIARSPLMLGADLPDTDPATLALLTNDGALAVSQNSTNNRQLFRNGDLIAWTADVPGSKSKYLAVFNAQDAVAGSSGNPKVPVSLADLGFGSGCRIHDIWTGQKLGKISGEFAPAIPFHGAGLYRVDPIQ